MRSSASPIHITEFVAESSGEKIVGGWKEGTWTLENQAEYAEQVYRLSFGHPSVQSLNWWGLSDRYIWNERPAGGLLDEQYNPEAGLYEAPEADKRRVDDQNNRHNV